MASTSRSRNANAAAVPDDYRRRQTLKNAERYITPELKAFEDKALSAQERALAREKLLYDELLDALAPHMPQLQRIARALAQLDVLAAFADCALRHDWCRPAFAEEPGMEIDGGRHPVVEQQVDSFIANDCALAPTAAPAADHRPQHGRQIDLHAADRADRAARPLRQFRAGRARGSARSTASSPASAPPTTSPPVARPSWSR